MFKITKSTKIVLSIIFLIILFLGIQIFSKPKIDTNSYVTLIKGTARLNNHSLIIKKKEKLLVNDIIKTGGSGSLVVIQWGEGSITRLGANTSIKINKNKINSELTNIQIFFSIIGNTGKTWSDVVSFIGDKSYFKEGFVDTEAAVRGTTFEINLDKNYIFVEKHEINLFNKNTNKNYIIPEKKPFNIKNFDFIALQKFILQFRDKLWENLNKNMDKQFFGFLKKNLVSFVSKGEKLVLTKHSIDFSKLSPLDKKRLYDELLSSYQSIKPSSISPKDGKLYNLKLEYQKILIKLAPDKDKADLLKTTVYDLKDAVNLKNFTVFKNITYLLGKNKNFVDFDEINRIVDFNGLGDSFKDNFNLLLKNFNFNGNLEKFNNQFGSDFLSFGSSMMNTLDSIKNKITDLTNNIFNK